MKKLLSFVTILMLSIVAVAMFPGCDKDEDTLLPEEFAPPTNLKAVSQMDYNVTISWSASPSAGSSDFVGYQVLVKENLTNTTFDSSVITGTSKTIQFASTDAGKSFSFQVRSKKSNNDVSTAITLNWGPTVRFLQKTLYEFASAYPNPSGYEFSSGNLYTMTSGLGGHPDNTDYVDIWLDGGTSATGTLTLKSPSTVVSTDTTWRHTKIAATNATSLEDQVDIPALSAFSDVTGQTVVLNKVYFAITHDGHYAKFQVVNINSSGANAYPNRTVDIVTSFNSGTGGWAKKGN